jgi:hypothetical protein
MFVSSFSFEIKSLNILPITSIYNCFSPLQHTRKIIIHIRKYVFVSLWFMIRLFILLSKSVVFIDLIIHIKHFAICCSSPNKYVILRDTQKYAIHHSLFLNLFEYITGKVFLLITAHFI